MWLGKVGPTEAMAPVKQSDFGEDEPEERFLAQMTRGTAEETFEEGSPFGAAKPPRQFARTSGGTAVL